MVQSSKKRPAAKKAVRGKAAKKTATTTSKSSVQKKAATKKKVTAKKAVKKKVVSKSNRSTLADIPSISISPQDRWKMIAIAAYHKAEARGFAPGGEVQDWLEAETEVDILIAG